MENNVNNQFEVGDILVGQDNHYITTYFFEIVEIKKNVVYVNRIPNNDFISNEYGYEPGGNYYVLPDFRKYNRNPSTEILKAKINKDGDLYFKPDSTLKYKYYLRVWDHRPVTAQWVD